MSLTKQQKEMLKKHKKHHTGRHMRKMRNLMGSQGKTFTEAHKIAQKEIGK